MEGENMNPFYAIILESSSNSWLQPSPPLITSVAQNCNISPYQNLGTITNPPPPPLSHPNGHVPREENIQEVNKNLNSNSDKNSGRGKKKAKPKATTWYKGPWTSREDRKLIFLVEHFGIRKWSSVAIFMPGRIGKQCRERWHNNLRPTIEKNVVWSDEEEMMIIKGHMRFGNKWSAIARFIPGRSENAVKNHWNSLKRKQLSTKQIKRAAKLRGLYQSNLLENYIKKLFFNPATATPPPPTTTVAPPPITTFATITPIAPPPTTLASPPFTTFATITPIAPPPPFTTTAAIAPPPTFTTSGSNALIPTDPPLSVDDYEVDGVPYFTFEIADLMQNLYTDDNGNANAMAGMYLPPPTPDADNGASTSYFAAETVDEEMSFMRRMFGNNGGV